MKFIIIFLFIFCSSPSQAQLLSYSVFKSKKEIGKMTVSRISSSGEVIYEKAFSTNNISLINCYFRSFIYSTYVITNLLRKPILTSVKKKIKQSSMKYRKPNQKDVDNFFKKKLSFF